MNLICKHTIGISHEFPTARCCANADDADDASRQRAARAVTPRTVTVRLSYCQSHVRKFCLVRVTRAGALLSTHFQPARAMPVCGSGGIGQCIIR